MALSLEEEEDCSILDEHFWQQVQASRDLQSSGIQQSNQAGNPCTEPVYNQSEVQNGSRHEGFPLHAAGQDWEMQRKEQGCEGDATAAVGCSGGEGMIVEKSGCERGLGGYWDSAGAKIEHEMPSEVVVTQSYCDSGAGNNGMVEASVSGCVNGHYASSSKGVGWNGVVDTEGCRGHCVPGAHIATGDGRTENYQEESCSFASGGGGVSNPRGEINNVPYNSEVGYYEMGGVGYSDGNHTSSFQGQDCEASSNGNKQDHVTYHVGREMNYSADDVCRGSGAGNEGHGEFDYSYEQASYDLNTGHNGSPMTGSEYEQNYHSSAATGNQAEDGNYVDTGWYQRSSSDVQFWLGVVNMPADVSKVHIMEMFRAEFELEDYRELQNEVKNAAGVLRSVQCIVAPKDWNIGVWSQEDLRYAVLKFWFESTIVASFRGSSQMWLQEVHANGSMTRGRTARVKILGLDVGSFYDRGNFVNRAQFEEASDIEMYLYLDFSSRSVVIMIDNRFTIEFNTKDMQSFVVVDFSFGSSAIYLTLKHPPKIFSVTHWEPSQMSFDPDPDTKIRQNKIGNLPMAVFAFCQTYRLQVESTNKCPAISNRNVQAVLDMLGSVGKDIYYAKVTQEFIVIYECSNCPIPAQPTMPMLHVPLGSEFLKTPQKLILRATALCIGVLCPVLL